MIRCIHSRILLTECASESLYSVQNISNIRIRLIFDSSNTLVYRLSPNVYVVFSQWKSKQIVDNFTLGVEKVYFLVTVCFPCLQLLDIFIECAQSIC